MKLKSVSGLTLYVKDLNKTAKFYGMLGFENKKPVPNQLTLYSNWFSIDFLEIGKDKRPDSYERPKGTAANKNGAGVFIYLSVEDVDEFYEELIANGIKLAAKPADQPWGNREFILCDPDGYNLVIFKRK